MFSHIVLGTNDIEKSKEFYDSIMPVLGYSEGVIDHKERCMYRSESGLFLLTKPINGEPASHGNGMTIGFSASAPELIDLWHETGIKNGGTSCEEPPGIRVSGEHQLYLGYLRDPSGNKICAAHLIVNQLGK